MTTYELNILVDTVFTNNRISSISNSGTDGSGYTVYHHITDHLGSVRAITNASTGNVVETSDFLPFGTRWSQTSGSSSATLTDATNRWRYSGKEEQKALNSSLPLIDYGARMYDPTIARWFSVDPMAEKYYHISPYSYCEDTPVRFLDPTGKFPIETIWDIGNVLYDVGAAVVNHIKGDHQDAKANWVNLGLDAGAMLIPYVPAGTSKVIKTGATGAKALDKAKDASKAARMTENTAKGKAFEKQVGESLGKNKASQVTIEAADGTRTKVDFVQNNDGKVTLIEAKGSQTAPLTPNKKKAHPQIKVVPLDCPMVKQSLQQKMRLLDQMI